MKVSAKVYRVPPEEISKVVEIFKVDITVSSCIRILEQRLPDQGLFFIPKDLDGLLPEVLESQLQHYYKSFTREAIVSFHLFGLVAVKKIAHEILGVVWQVMDLQLYHLYVDVSQVTGRKTYYITDKRSMKRVENVRFFDYSHHAPGVDGNLRSSVSRLIPQWTRLRTIEGAHTDLIAEQLRPTIILEKVPVDVGALEETQTPGGVQHLALQAQPLRFRGEQSLAVPTLEDAYKEAVKIHLEDLKERSDMEPLTQTGGQDTKLFSVSAGYRFKQIDHIRTPVDVSAERAFWVREVCSIMGIPESMIQRPVSVRYQTDKQQEELRLSYTLRGLATHLELILSFLVSDAVGSELRIVANQEVGDEPIALVEPPAQADKQAEPQDAEQPKEERQEPERPRKRRRPNAPEDASPHQQERTPSERVGDSRGRRGKAGIKREIVKRYERKFNRGIMYDIKFILEKHMLNAPRTKIVVIFQISVQNEMEKQIEISKNVLEFLELNSKIPEGTLEKRVSLQMLKTHFKGLTEFGPQKEAPVRSEEDVAHASPDPSFLVPTTPPDPSGGDDRPPAGPERAVEQQASPGLDAFLDRAALTHPNPLVRMALDLDMERVLQAHNMQCDGTSGVRGVTLREFLTSHSDQEIADLRTRLVPLHA